MVLHQCAQGGHDVVRVAMGSAPGQCAPQYAALVAPAAPDSPGWHVHLWPWPARAATVHFFDIPDDWLRQHTHCAALLLTDEASTPVNWSQQGITEAIDQQLTLADFQGLAQLDLVAARHTRWPEAEPHGGRDATHIAVASCQYASGMIDGAPPASTWTPGPADLSYHRLGQWRRHTHLDALLLVGDQVYNDATAGLFDPAAVDDRYHGPYRHWLSRRVVRQALAGPMVHALPDDHEFHDNWSPIGPLHTRFGDNNHVRDNGLAAYFAHLRGSADQTGRPVWSHFQQGPIACFMMDTRTERERRQARTLGQARIMSSVQRHALKAWLGQHASGWAPKVVASPSMLLPRRHTSVASEAGALHSDAWDGYPAAQHDLLGLLWEQQAKNVVFVSGDEHLGCVCEITITCPDQPERNITAWSVHCPALYAPYPFANSRREDFVPRESFSLRRPGPHPELICHVDTWYPRPGDGFAVLRFHRPNERWQGQVSFVQEDIAHGLPQSPEVCRTLF
ncbi:alkaline phosphatase D family protein [Aquabacterium sp.]|uniref:alkaline phosphatase D family protein n=1 Tax=Aquabacterium sp. TaxID=1872578 RepID=UPI003D6CA980